MWRTKAFDIVLRDHAQLKGNYEASLKKVKSLQKILDARERCLQLASRKIVPSYDQFVQSLSEVNDEKFRFIKQFEQNRYRNKIIIPLNFFQGEDSVDWIHAKACGVLSLVA